MTFPPSGNLGTTDLSKAPDNKSQSADDVYDLLSQDDKVPDKTPDKADKTPKDKTTDDDEDIKLVEDDDEDKLKLDDDEDDEDKKDKKDKSDKGKDDKKTKTSTEEDDDDLELDTPPKKREILAKYPDLFKTFPWFEKMMYRDRQYTELFGSFDDAREVHEQAQVLQRFEQDLMGGNLTTILKQIKENEPKAFDKLVDNYLSGLANVDKEAYVEICGNIGKHIIKDLVMESRNLAGSNKEQADLLQQVALVLNQYLFGTTTYVPPKARTQEDDKENELKEEQRNFVRQRYESSRDDLQTRVDNTLRATITDYIDRNNEMSSYVKRNAVNDAMHILHNAMANDKAFRNNLDKLWETAFSQNFSQNSLNQIRSFYLGKAKRLLKPVITKARSEALKEGASRIVSDNDKNDSEERPSRKGPITSGRPRQSSGKSERQQGESVSEFFMRD